MSEFKSNAKDNPEERIKKTFEILFGLMDMANRTILSLSFDILYSAIVNDMKKVIGKTYVIISGRRYK